MKYMTLNSSCAFAGVANLLEQYGVDIEDRDLCLGMKLPYLFENESGKYLAGTMLQSADWFNRFLCTIGFRMREILLPRDQVPAYLCQERCAMLGLRLSPRSKHAVVYVGREGDRLLFVNNKWRNSDEPETLSYSQKELLEGLDGDVMVATVTPIPVEPAPDDMPLYRRSRQVLGELKQDIAHFCAVEQTPRAIAGAMDPLFRAILLDGITMLDLAGKADLAEKLRGVQREFLTAVRSKKAAVLSDLMSVDTLAAAIDEYSAWIAEETGCGGLAE